jgi:integrase
LVRDQDLNDDDYLFQSRTGGKLSNRAARDVVKRAAKRAYEQTKQQDMLDISSHDLRRYWANKMLNEHDINPRIVMAMGGWAAFDSMRPYMEPATPANITASMIAADNE